MGKLQMAVDGRLPGAVRQGRSGAAGTTGKGSVKAIEAGKVGKKRVTTRAATKGPA